VAFVIGQSNKDRFVQSLELNYCDCRLDSFSIYSAF